MNLVPKCSGWSEYEHETTELLVKVIIKGTAPGDPGDILYLCPECLEDYLVNGYNV